MKYIFAKKQYVQRTLLLCAAISTNLFQTLAQDPSDHSLKAFFRKQKAKQEKRWEIEKINTTTALGFGLATEQNTVVSPLIYSGSAVTFSSERQRILPKRMDNVYVKSQLGVLGIENSDESGTQIYLRAGFEMLKPTKNNAYFGPTIQVNGNYISKLHLGNNGVQLELHTSLGIAGQKTFPIHLFKKNVELQTVARLPLIGSLIATPNYAHSFDAGGKALFTSLHNSLNPQTQIWFTSPANKRFPNRRIRYGYEWQMNRFKKANDFTITNGSHMLHFAASITKIK
jgi:hypothetical protein